MATTGYENCIDDPRSLIPINMMCIGACIHFFICLILFWAYTRGREFYGANPDTDETINSTCECGPTFIKVIKYMIAILFFVCAAIQTVLDYRQYIKSSKHINSSWKTYQCSIFLFSNSPNAIHAVAAIFSLGTAVIVDRFDKSVRIALFIFVIGEVFVGILITPFFASIFTHLIAGLFAYGWIAIFVFAGSIFIFYKMNDASLEKRGTMCYLFIGVFISMLLMVLLIVVTNNTQIKLYDGIGYIESLKLTLTERKTKEYFETIFHSNSFDSWFTFVWLIL